MFRVLMTRYLNCRQFKMDSVLLRTYSNEQWCLSSYICIQLCRDNCLKLRSVRVLTSGELEKNPTYLIFPFL